MTVTTIHARATDKPTRRPISEGGGFTDGGSSLTRPLVDCGVETLTPLN